MNGGINCTHARTDFQRNSVGSCPKLCEYVLRLTGVIHCHADVLHRQHPPGNPIRGGLGAGHKDRQLLPGADSRCPTVDRGRMTILRRKSPSGPCCWPKPWTSCGPTWRMGAWPLDSFMKQYNMIAPKTQRIGKPRGMGAVLRAVKLTISPGKHDANGHRAAKCLEWDKKTETFIKQCLQCLQQEKTQDWQEYEDTDVERLHVCNVCDVCNCLSVCRHGRHQRINVCTVKPSSVVGLQTLQTLQRLNVMTIA